MGVPEPEVPFREFLATFENVDKTIGRVQAEIESLRAAIDQNLRQRNVDQAELGRQIERLTEQQKLLKSHREELESYIEAEEPKEILAERDRCHERQPLIDQIVSLDQFFDGCQQIKDLIRDSKQRFDRNEYYEARSSIIQARDLYRKINDQVIATHFVRFSSDSRLRKSFDVIMKRLDQELTVARETFVYNLIQLFRSNAKFQDDDGKVFRFEFLCSITAEQYESYIKCILEERFDFLMYFRHVFDVFSQEFVTKILEDNQMPKRDTFDDEKNRPVKTIRLADSVEENPIQNLSDFIRMVLEIFTCDGAMNRDTETDLRRYLGEMWSEQLFDRIIHCYLERSMPRSEAEFEKLIPLLKQTEKLEEEMKRLGMGDSDATEKDSILKQYGQDIQKHFTNKICQDYIVRMKRFVKREPKASMSSEELLKDWPLEHKQKIKFAPCQISDYMMEIKNLFQEMSSLLSGSTSSDLKLLLSDTFQLVSELFVSVAPYVHRELIETDARQNAIFHNNCLLFGYLLESLALTHRPQLNSLFETVPSVRNMASQIFCDQMKYQERVLLAPVTPETNSAFTESLSVIANEIPSTDLRVSSQAHFEFRQCLNKCLKRLSYLHEAFGNAIVAEKVYRKVFETMLCMLMGRVIDALLALDDISSLGSSHLYNEIDYFCKELKLFLVDSESVIFKWMKLNEINFLLKSSLMEILNRWAEGKGILSTYLTADEVKRLIRALFQNNERRANVLAKIK